MSLYSLKDNHRMKTYSVSEHLTKNAAGESVYSTHMLPDGHVLITDLSGHSISKFMPGDKVELIWKCDEIILPTAVCSDQSGLIYVAFLRETDACCLSHKSPGCFVSFR